MELLKNYDTSLAQRASRGDRTAFREIVEDNKQKIFYLAYHLTGSLQDAEDLSQEVFIKAYNSMDAFRGDAAMGSWLYRITLNAYLDQKRKKSSQFAKEQHSLNEHIPGEDLFTGPSAASNPEKYAESQQLQMHIDNALNHLSPRERSIFVMRHYQDMPGKKVGSILNISEGTVKSLLSRAVKKMRNTLQNVVQPGGNMPVLQSCKDGQTLSKRAAREVL